MYCFFVCACSSKSTARELCNTKYFCLFHLSHFARLASFLFTVMIQLYVMTSLKTKGHCLQIWIRQPDVLNQAACGIMWPACYYRDFIASTSEDHGTAAATQSSHLWFRPSSSSSTHKILPFYVLLPQELSSVVTWKLRRQPTPWTNPSLHIFFLLETLGPITQVLFSRQKKVEAHKSPQSQFQDLFSPRWSFSTWIKAPPELLKPSSTQGFISPCSFHPAVCPPSSPNQSKLSSAKGNDF